MWRAPHGELHKLGGGARETERRDGEISLYDLPYYFTFCLCSSYGLLRGKL